MANSIVFMDGFDFYNSATMPFTQRYRGAGSYTYGVAGRFGGQAMRYNNSGGKPIASLPAPTDTLVAGFALATTWAGADFIFLSVLDASGGAIISLSMNSTGVLKLWRGFGDSLLASAAAVPNDTSFHYFELISVRSAAAGTAQVWVDGVQYINVNSLSLGTVSYYGMVFGNTQLGGGIDHFDIDDLYMANQSTRIGERRVETLHPTSDITKQWTPDTGVANFSRVNESNTDGDTSYVSSNIVGAHDLYGIGALSSTPQTIDAVQTVMVARKTDATTRTARSNVKSGPTTGVGATASLPSSYGLIYDIFTSDPNGSAVWTAVAVASLGVGIELVV